jgi:hypothetical protein
MDELQAAIKETAEKFAQCFQNKGNFDFSIQSLHDVNDFLDLKNSKFTSIIQQLGLIFLKLQEEIMEEHIIGLKR